MKKVLNLPNWVRALALCSVLAITGSIYYKATASDHDDGENDNKARSLNLTDLYVFREDKEIATGDPAYMVFIVNTNPRSLPQQQYYFSTQARYDIHVSRVGTSKDVPVSTDDDVILRFQFGAPSAGQQAITLTTIIDGVSTSYASKDGGGSILTTTHAGGGSPVNNLVTAGANTMTVFAGLRQDPFFFDVTAFFKFRIAAATAGVGVYPPGFTFPNITPNADAVNDFTANYNVNTIAVRVPIAMLQTAAGETVYDTWTTVSIPQ